MENKNEELTEWGKQVLRYLQFGKSYNPDEQPAGELIEKGYAYREYPGILKLTEKGLNYK